MVDERKSKIHSPYTSLIKYNAFRRIFTRMDSRHTMVNMRARVCFPVASNFGIEFRGISFRRLNNTSTTWTSFLRSFVKMKFKFYENVRPSSSAKLEFSAHVPLFFFFFASFLLEFTITRANLQFGEIPFRSVWHIRVRSSGVVRYASSERAKIPHNFIHFQ